jgi:hypothetical protein
VRHFWVCPQKTVVFDKSLQGSQKLEVSKYPDETQPVGGYDAGVAIMLQDGNII